MINRLIVIALYFNEKKLSFVSVITTYIIIEKVYNIIKLSINLSFQDLIKQSLVDILNLKNIQQYFTENKYHFDSNNQIAYRTGVFILSAQYYLFYKGEFFQIQSQLVQNLVLVTCILNYILPGMLNCILCSTVNDLLFTTNNLQILYLGIQSLALLSLETAIYINSNQTALIYLISKVLITSIQVYFASKNNLPINYYYQNSQVKMYIVLFSLLSIPYNYMPFTNYISNSHCIRDKQQFHDIFLQFGRITQFIQFIIGYTTLQLFQQKDAQKVSNLQFEVILTIFYVSYCLLNMIYILNIIYRKVTKNYIYFYKPQIKIDELITVIEKSPNILYLEIVDIEGVTIVQGQKIIDRQTLKENFNKNLTEKQKQILFNLLFWEHPIQDQKYFKIYIGNLIQIYQASSAFYSFFFYDMIINAIENREILSQRYLINKNFTNQQEKDKYFKAILNRMFKFGYSQQIANLYKTHVQNQNIKQICQEFQSLILNSISFYNFIPSEISLNPQQIYYDLYEFQ
ncbi:hypothetical protein ABPG74_011518 [Tetrahymena malaccensis]